jgi:hypothetical protein
VSHSEDDISRARCPTYTVKEPLKEKPRLHAEVLECFEKRGKSNGAKIIWSTPIFEYGEVFALRDKDRMQAAR